MILMVTQLYLKLIKLIDKLTIIEESITISVRPLNFCNQFLTRKLEVKGRSSTY